MSHTFTIDQIVKLTGIEPERIPIVLDELERKGQLTVEDARDGKFIISLGGKWYEQN